MHNNNSEERPRFYFSFPRLIAKLRGADATRAESNWLEAWLIGLAIYFVSWIFFAVELLPSNLPAWQVAVLVIVLAFFIWLFWLLVLYINSRIIRWLQLCGLFRTIPTRRAQSILLVTLTTAMAGGLLTHGLWTRAIGIAWIVAVSTNLVSALVLDLIDAAHRPNE